ncbi:MAG TPA: acyl-CoA dehydrogenase family protein [Actinomycetota bacterium]|nr:acyl-CoA dehydrogenase family protein [Actinomycetota bacterium]
MSVIQIPEELLELRGSLTQFIEREVRPLEDERRHEIQEKGTFEGIEETRRELRRRSAELGFYALHMPEDLGGGGLPYLGQVIMIEEVCRHGLILAQTESVIPIVTGPTPIYLDCTDEQKDRFLKPLMTAEKSTCFALTEPEAGSDATRIKTRAVQDGDSWVLNGRKHFITGGKEADFALVFAVTDPEKRAQGGISAFFVEKDTPGYSVTRVQRTMSPFQNPVELTFEDCRVPAENVLGQVGFGFYSAVKGINGARLQIAATALGTARNLLERMTEYAQTRIAFERPIGANQYVQGMIVDSFAELEQARLLVYKLASDIDDGADGRREAALAKLVSTEAVGRIADRCIQIHGGNGFMTELGVESWYRDVRAMRLYEGTSEILRTNVAKTLGLPSS